MKIMRKSKSIIAIAAAGLVLFGTSSCKKFLEGYDEDPNNPTEVTPDLLLSTSQVATAYVYGSDYARYSDMWVQHQAGTDRQFSAIGSYTITESDMDNIWRFNAYGGGMEDLHGLMNSAGNTAYQGIASILMAANLGLLTDGFGDIPYSDAFQGADNTKPTYDSQQDIYNTIISLLSGAGAQLDAESALYPGADDLMYGGDLDKWKKAANALLARYYLHLANNDASNYQKALDAIDAGAFESNDDDLEVPFGSLEVEHNIWFQFLEQRPGYISMGKYFIDQLNALSDPRLAVYATQNDMGVYEGAAPGDATSSSFSILGSAYASEDSPIPVMTYVEQKFIEAEAAFNTGDMSRAATAYNDGVAASLDKFGIDDPTYLATNASETSGSITLEKIMMQKYYGMLTQFESWTDYRRTGIPAITPASGSAVPTRFLYPLSERLYNKDNVDNEGTITIYQKLWWDN